MKNIMRVSVTVAVQSRKTSLRRHSTCSNLDNLNLKYNTSDASSSQFAGGVSQLMHTIPNYVCCSCWSLLLCQNWTRIFFLLSHFTKIKEEQVHANCSYCKLLGLYQIVRGDKVLPLPIWRCNWWYIYYTRLIYFSIWTSHMEDYGLKATIIIQAITISSVSLTLEGRICLDGCILVFCWKTILNLIS
jgi:hypothetical protein